MPSDLSDNAFAFLNFARVCQQVRLVSVVNDQIDPEDICGLAQLCAAVLDIVLLRQP